MHHPAPQLARSTNPVPRSLAGASPEEMESLIYRQLGKTIQQIGFGYIEQLIMHGGAPRWRKETRWKRVIQLLRPPEPERKRRELPLEAETWLEDMRRHLRPLPDGTPIGILIQAGLPCRIDIFGDEPFPL